MNLESDIAVFVRIIELGTFAATAAELRMTSSGVSRIITRLEGRMGARLLHRSTRRLLLTQEGERFLQHARPIVAALEQARSAVAHARGKPCGTVRINVGTAYAKHGLAPMLPKLLKQFPDVHIELSVDDRRINPIAEQIDITVRVGPLDDSSLLAVKIGEVRRTIAASPKYLRAHGRPRRPSDLLKHNCLLLAGFSRLAQWPMLDAGRKILVPVKGSVVRQRGGVAGSGHRRSRHCPLWRLPGA
ncbi:LysR family transcriptional regulator [Bradyrhizobium sp. HKCCYLS20291]|uniref:LysR family transcriptional regulator n=1 Tax=Bradyrhizobium sp. HKCCYLS20291 TaxID=3420766 RepID=UPI003EBB28B1